MDNSSDLSKVKMKSDSKSIYALSLGLIQFKNGIYIFPARALCRTNALVEDQIGVIYCAFLLH